MLLCRVMTPRGAGGMPPRKCFKFRCSEVASGAHNGWKSATLINKLLSMPPPPTFYHTVFIYMYGAIKSWGVESGNAAMPARPPYETLQMELSRTLQCLISSVGHSPVEQSVSEVERRRGVHPLQEAGKGVRYPPMAGKSVQKTPCHK